ncbi:MAG: class I SAM-dependent methyltransferase [Gammaproteobacteria bacterium]|nr:class I SAM-dependent methyltransferase [Gammaproteobacteria bacterium]NIR97388.1 class I SAM-dependent methyltransferase [Gammaproteobacteria bacterium]NIT63041.1 class I SAM-dependent methyltransferase [Gammaproteobacteria bacterium]NIV20003.1 methyltransferase domain-containing protein [Gammaproteobacteria bacterium]NIX10079.1 methyltransferase domain-containing protein [Gammaproteobacteria bacterium]
MPERQRHWDQVYREKGPTQVSWHQDRPDASLALIAEAGIEPDVPLIDVGGGASRVVDSLLDRGYRDVTVLDISTEALDLARARLGDLAGMVSWIHGDITEFVPSRRYALWHDRAVFHFLTEAEDRRRYREAMMRGLASNGHVIIATFGLNGPEKCSGLPVVRYDADKLTAELGGELELVETRDEPHRTPSGATQAFTCFRLRRRAG